MADDNDKKIEEALAAYRKKLLVSLATALLAAATAAWSKYSAPAEEKVKSGYDLLVQNAKKQEERIRRLETLLAVSWLGEGRDPQAISSMLSPETLTLLRVFFPSVPQPAASAPADPLSDLLNLHPAAPETPPEVGAAPVRVLLNEMARSAKAQPQTMPTFDAL